MHPDLEDPCDSCGAPAGVQCRPDCPDGFGQLAPGELELPGDGTGGISGYPDTLIDGLIEGGGCL
ncbi:hypothetical protein ACWFMI_23660 [Nocardiopsis terrae]|uniref:hypothetical protein n=1 Tax=Streptomyces sp. NPDC057554 TaxID=3350538 RepID=UPI0036ADE940